jgi:hypothetical protein
VHPGYGAGQVAPTTPHAPPWQVSPRAKQLSHALPYKPQLRGPVPGAHVPFGVQQPLQLSGPQCGPV